MNELSGERSRLCVNHQIGAPISSKDIDIMCLLSSSASILKGWSVVPLPIPLDAHKTNTVTPLDLTIDVLVGGREILLTVAMVSRIKDSFVNVYLL